MLLDAITDILNLGQFSLVNSCKINLVSNYIFNILTSASVIPPNNDRLGEILGDTKMDGLQEHCNQKQVEEAGDIILVLSDILGFPRPISKVKIHPAFHSSLR